MTDCEKPRIRGLLSYGMVKGSILLRLDVSRGVKGQDEGRRLLGALSMWTGGDDCGEGRKREKKGTSPARKEEEKNKNDDEKLQRYRTPKQTSEKEMKIGGMGIIR
jgi:hypothetical protein